MVLPSWTDTYLEHKIIDGERYLWLKFDDVGNYHLICRAGSEDGQQILGPTTVDSPISSEDWRAMIADDGYDSAELDRDPSGDQNTVQVTYEGDQLIPRQVGYVPQVLNDPVRPEEPDKFESALMGAYEAILNDPRREGL